MVSTEAKAKRAAAARANYKANREAEQLRKFLFRISKGAIPTFSSMTKFGLDLGMINAIRKDYDLGALKPELVKGYKKEKQQIIASNKRSKTDILNSVVTNIEIPEKAHEMSIKHKSMIDDPDTKVTLKYYLECLSTKVVSRSLNNYKRYLTMILEYFGYEEENSIIPILKQYDNVKDYIENKAVQLSGPNKGKPYQPVTKKLFWQSISTGLVKDYCIAYSSQMPDGIAKKYITTTALKNSKDQERRRAETQNQNLKLDEWETKIQPLAKDFINNENTSTLDKALIQVYTQLGGVPRTSTFLNLHKVDDMKSASNKNKNYIVIKKEKDTTECTIISNVHKTGINENKTGGMSIVLALHKKHKQVMKNLLELAKGNDMVFQIKQDYLNKLFQRVFGMTNQKLRKINETYIQNKGSLDDIILASYVNGHTIATARAYYAKLEEDVDDAQIKKMLAQVKKDEES